MTSRREREVGVFDDRVALRQRLNACLPADLAMSALQWRD